MFLDSWATTAAALKAARRGELVKVGKPDTDSLSLSASARKVSLGCKPKNTFDDHSQNRPFF